MKPILEMDAFMEAGKGQVGGKAFCLGRMHEQGFDVPKTVCVPRWVYDAYVEETHLKDSVSFQINQKPFKQMRWEEIWDISLRIRNLFLTAPIPEHLGKQLAEAIRETFKDAPVAIRSSAPGEDDEGASFAGLHDSYLNIVGTEAILKHIQLVWASLYSDAALLYRKELGLDTRNSAMAVLIQELIPSERSGVFFGVNPSNSNESVIESVYGLNQGLVDGDVEPDRWMLDRSSGKILNHVQPPRKRYATPELEGVAFAELSQASIEKPPLSDPEVFRLWETGRKLERLFGRPQDVEWTFFKGRLVVLQARPITSAGFKETDDKRTWYLSLHRSYENLKRLYEKIETRLIPDMVSQAKSLGQVSLNGLSAKMVGREIVRRQEIYDHWVRVYWSDFIPFAHGIRLFGQTYNDAIQPRDPYEFMTLLENTGLKSVRRNTLLESLADMIRKDAELKGILKSGADALGSGHPFRALLDEFVSEFGDLSCSTGGGNECQHGQSAIIRLLMEFAKAPPKQTQADQARSGQTKSGEPDFQTLQAAFIKSFPESKQAFAADVLHLGRESHRLRDDDNIYLGRIEDRLVEAVREGRSRLADANLNPDERAMLSDIPALFQGPDEAMPPPVDASAPLPDQASSQWVKTRQVVGHPAGPGIAQGIARLINEPRDLMDFQQGEVLICPGVDPNMTFVIPLAAAVVEERGGMLIHGAIIAREYGLPCVTGASDIMRLIKTGDDVTVDGYLGIITCKTRDLE